MLRGRARSVGRLNAFLADEADPLVFLMYDDRGAILHAPTADRLRPLYERFDGWVVPEWRPQMDAIIRAEPQGPPRT